jgi:hypothetical protein
MEDFQRSVNWSAPDRADQANRLAQRLALQAVLKYQQDGNLALGTYRDKDHPTAVAETFASLLGVIKALPVYLPELEQYLLDYPHATIGRNHIRVLLEIHPLLTAVRYTIVTARA